MLAGPVAVVFAAPVEAEPIVVAVASAAASDWADPDQLAQS